MKRTLTAYKPQSKNSGEPAARLCTEARSATTDCSVIRAAVNRAKDRLVNEYSGKVDRSSKVLSLAITEAEALAWQTGLPHLFFPALAIEKAEAAVKWHRNQQRVRRKAVELAFAA